MIFLFPYYLSNVLKHFEKENYVLVQTIVQDRKKCLKKMSAPFPPSPPPHFSFNCWWL